MGKVPDSEQLNAAEALEFFYSKVKHSPKHLEKIAELKLNMNNLPPEKPQKQVEIKENIQTNLCRSTKDLNTLPSENTNA